MHACARTRRSSRMPAVRSSSRTAGDPTVVPGLRAAHETRNDEAQSNSCERSPRHAAVTRGAVLMYDTIIVAGRLGWLCAGQPADHDLRQHSDADDPDRRMRGGGDHRLTTASVIVRIEQPD